MGRFNKLMLAVLVPGLITLCACQDLVPRDTRSLLIPSLRRSEIFGFLAGFGTTFAAVPDLTAMLRRRSSAGMNPRMATIMGAFQILWSTTACWLLRDWWSYGTWWRCWSISWASVRTFISSAN